MVDLRLLLGENGSLLATIEDMQMVSDPVPLADKSEVRSSRRWVFWLLAIGAVLVVLAP
jgi:hypothetical protein